MAGPSFQDGSGSVVWARVVPSPNMPANANAAAKQTARTSLVMARPLISDDVDQLLPLPSVILRITSSMPKLAAFMRGGNWAKLCSHFET